MNVFNALFGASWGTTLVGYVVAAITAAYAVMPSASGQHVDWKAVGLAAAAAIFGRITKMTGVSNAPNPLPNAKTVPPPVSGSVKTL